MNLKTICVLVFAFFVTSCAKSNVPVETPVVKTTIEKGVDSTVALVSTTMDDGPEITYPFCTGVWINKDTVLTALHCARGAARNAEIRKLPPDMREFAKMLLVPPEDPTGTEILYITDKEVTGLESKPTATHKSKVVAIDNRHDLALLKADNGNIPDHMWLPISNYMPKVGDSVVIVGHQGGLYFTVMGGSISALRYTFPVDLEDDFNIEGPLLQVFSGIYKGNSGGPIISQDGKLLGIASFIGRAPNQGFAIAPPAIKDFIIKCHLKHLL